MEYIVIDRKEYMRSSYSKHWKNVRKNVYGFMEYDKAFITLIDSFSKKLGKILEVAIGTGEPIANNLEKIGYQVYGIDISDRLIDECKKNNKNIRCEVGDAEQLKFANEEFDLTYCVHSSWFIPDFNKAVAQMVRVSKTGGVVLFDIQNIHNREIDKIYRFHIFENGTAIGMLYKTIKNSVKFILQKGTQDWPFIISQTPSDPIAIYDMLKDRLNVEQINIYTWHDESMIDLGSVNKEYEEYPRLIFVVKK
jgi:ubiquinone/menaquinone biosynthesis C-methylase UbiE